MHDSHQTIKLHLVLELLWYSRNKRSLKNDVKDNNRKPIKLHSISRFLQYNKN